MITIIIILNLIEVPFPHQRRSKSWKEPGLLDEGKEIVRSRHAPGRLPGCHRPCRLSAWMARIGHWAWRSLRAAVISTLDRSKSERRGKKKNRYKCGLKDRVPNKSKPTSTKQKLKRRPTYKWPLDNGGSDGQPRSSLLIRPPTPYYYTYNFSITITYPTWELSEAYKLIPPDENLLKSNNPFKLLLNCLFLNGSYFQTNVKNCICDTPFCSLWVDFWDDSLKFESHYSLRKMTKFTENRRYSLLRASQETLLQLKFVQNFCLRMRSREGKEINITWKTFRE